MGRPSLTDDPIIKVTFKNCEKGEIYIRKSFRSEWDELVNNLKKEIRREFKTYKTRSEDGGVKIWRDIQNITAERQLLKINHF